MLNFLELKSQFEADLVNKFSVELLEMQYAPYSFGSGFAAYQVRGKIVRLNFDGKDEWIKVEITANLAPYPFKDSQEIFSGTFKMLRLRLFSILEDIER